MSDPVIEAKHLSLEYRIGKTWLNAVQDVTFSIHPNEIHGLVGESGSGKSTLGMGLMGYLPDNARYASGSLMFDGKDLTQISAEEMRQIRGNLIGFVPQNPLDALNPTLTIGEQMMEVTRYHLGLSTKEAYKRANDALYQTRIADAEAILQRYPHQLSGGMQQRVMIAMALSTRPRLLVLDEPTTALDVTTQAVILDLVRDLIRDEQAAALYISHNLGTVAQLCDTVTVMYAGEVMESAPVHDLFQNPFHPYTAGLLASLPSAATGSQSRLSTIPGAAPSLATRPSACVFAARCPVAIEKCHAEKPALEKANTRAERCWRWQEIANGSVIPRNPPQGVFEEAAPEAGYVLQARHLRKSFRDSNWLDRLMGKPPQEVHAVDDVSLKVNRRATLGLVGESGSGKTTLARAIVGLETADSGDIELLNQPIKLDLRERDRHDLRQIRMIFQNPGDALNPFYTIGAIIGRTLQVAHRDKREIIHIEQAVADLLVAVGLTEDYADRYPAQLSGGEKQRVAIARAFAAQPALIIADEPTSSLDVSVQAVILNLLKDLRARESVSYLLISHDLEVVGYLADWIAVMYLGEIVEQGTNEQVRNPPMHPYTEALLAANPIPDPTRQQTKIRLEGDVPSPRNKPTGCPFHTRCPRFLGQICVEQAPPLRETPDGHQILCHIPLDELRDLQNQTKGTA
jgi:peptide/nickel transport system ATP-binding protein